MRFNFQNRIVTLLVALMALVLAAVFAAVFYAMQQNMQANAREELSVGSRVFSRVLEDHGRHLLQSASTLMRMQRFRDAVTANEPQTMLQLLRQQADLTGADLAVFIPETGEVMAVEPADQARRALDDAFRAHLRRDVAGHARQGHVAVSVPDSRHAYQVAYVPLSINGQTAWIGMGGRIDAGMAGELRRLTGLDVTFLTDQTDTDSILISTLPNRLRQTLHDMADGDVRQPHRGDIHVETLQGRDILRTVKLLDDDPDLPLYAVLQTPLKTARAAYTRLQYELIVIAFLALCIALLLALLVARGVTRPIRQLAAAARRVANGNYHASVNIRRSDELGQLATTFNRMQHDIADREAHIAHQTQHDALTGLPNRRLAQDRLNHAVERTLMSPSIGAILMLDLDRFKEINDILGYKTGDRVLRQTARRLRRTIGDADTLARIGGNEFLIILACSNRHHAGQVARQVIAALSEPLETAGTHFELDVSVGIAMFPEQGKRAELLMRRAEIAMYDARACHERLLYYKIGRDERYLHRLGLLRDLPRAVNENQLTLYFQPKIALATKSVAHAEALVRWRHPQHGLIPPDEFIFLAEHAGYINTVTRWVLREAIAQCRRWRDEGLALSVAVNLSALDLQDADLPGFIRRQLQSRDLPGSTLVLEITESALMLDMRHAISTLSELKNEGMHISIDDFGTGYSSLAQLKRLPVDELKIDKSFVMTLAAGTDDDVIVGSTIGLAHSMGLRVIAEGVETQAGWDVLVGHGCDMGQGFYISPPIPSNDFSYWCRSRQAGDGALSSAR